LKNVCLDEFQEAPCSPGKEMEDGCKFCYCMKRGIGYLCSRDNCHLTNGILLTREIKFFYVFICYVHFLIKKWFQMKFYINSKLMANFHGWI